MKEPKSEAANQDGSSALASAHGWGAQPTATEPHDCYRWARVIKCDNVTDVRKCRVCGREWESDCDFDDEYS